ncbi:AbrB/MazE/SpoVT family DNA-binding domain-containing protein [Rhodoferax sp. U11-2br]|uniref:AbrB/MazE/SpoVT family DNA-binding domain-containing protein n=1 Tax=Rhodoferax sp. U11-2br TaxID=2838878 RepID=UPI001BE8DD6F|nr:AbrB/MazE/SpoVT family DNA-binding domain-containing protein [Rhodoferax sp. U11-2br]MBT3065667.1 AbrB/MazE/SpoVT family DNA-binding domain-containing protein [Rhodoferax sp. U11-2br]
MHLTRLSSKGQITIPKALRDAHDWQVGARLEVIDTVEGVLLKPVVARQSTALPEGLAAIRSRLAYKGPAVSLEDLNAAVLQEATSGLQN